ncbi:hypothetical protein IW139_004300, partial [Coemansia sp. RSA 353]
LFSAIHPSQRQQWAETYARLIVPQGTLIVLLYPLIRRGQTPPYRVTMAECEVYLKRYFVLVRVDPNCRCTEGHEGNELMSLASTTLGVTCLPSRKTGGDLADAAVDTLPLVHWPMADCL